MENKVIKGDCLEELQKINNDSVDLVLIDPPYNVGKDKRWDKWKKEEEYINFLINTFKESERVLKPTGSFYFFHNDFRVISKLQNRIEEETGFIFKSFVTWDKGDWRSISWKNPSEKNNLRSWFNNCEYILYYTLQKGSGIEHFNYIVHKPYLDYMTCEKDRGGFSCKDLNKMVGCKSIASHWFWQDDDWTKQSQPHFITREKYEKIQKSGFFKRDYEELRGEFEELRQKNKNLRYTHNLDENHNNVWRFPTENTGKYHPTQKPFKVIDRIIKTSTNEGDVVLDFFGGSGTTAISCKKLNRKYILIEREEEYINIIKERLKEVDGNEQ